MDAALARRSVDDAFAAQVEKLFAIMCSNHVNTNRDHAVDAFTKGYDIALDCHAEASKLVDELVKA